MSIFRAMFGRAAPLLASAALALASCSRPPEEQGRGFPAPERPVSAIVSPEWLNEADRDKARESAQIVRLMGIKRGMNVADIGAGGGYHTVRLSPVLGPEGRVYAQDITPSYLADLGQRVQDAGLDNVRIVRGAPDDPLLPPRSIDAAIMIHMYHEIEQPYAFLHNLAPALRPGARVGVTDLDRPTDRHGTPPALLRCEFEAVGYRQLSVHQLEGDIGYLAIFEAPATPVAPEAIRPCGGRAAPAEAEPPAR